MSEVASPAPLRDGFTVTDPSTVQPIGNQPQWPKGVRGAKPLHVVFVLRSVPSYRMPFLTALASDPKVRVTVVTAAGLSEKGKLSNVSETKGLSLLTVKGWQLEVWKYTLIWMRGCRRLLRTLDCDVVVMEGSFGILSHVPLAQWAKRHSKAVVFWTSGWNKPTVTGLAMVLREMYLRLAFKTGDHFVCYSTAAAAWLDGLGVPPSRVTVAQNTIDVEGIAGRSALHEERARQLRTEHGIGQDPVVVYVGALTRDKHIERLVAVHRAIRARGIALHTVVIGDGPSREEIAVASHTARGFHMLGRVVDDVDAYFAMGDVFLLPGLGGLAINQAMANGLPVLCTRADGTERDLVVDGVTGYYRPNYDVGEWTELVAGLLAKPEKRRTMGDAARAHVLQRASLVGMCHAFRAAVRYALTHRARDPLQRS